MEFDYTQYTDEDLAEDLVLRATHYTVPLNEADKTWQALKQNRTDEHMAISLDVMPNPISKSCFQLTFVTSAIQYPWWMHVRSMTYEFPAPSPYHWHPNFLKVVAKAVLNEALESINTEMDKNQVPIQSKLKEFNVETIDAFAQSLRRVGEKMDETGMRWSTGDVLFEIPLDPFNSTVLGATFTLLDEYLFFHPELNHLGNQARFFENFYIKGYLTLRSAYVDATRNKTKMTLRFASLIAILCYCIDAAAQVISSVEHERYLGKMAKNNYGDFPQILRIMGQALEYYQSVAKQAGLNIKTGAGEQDWARLFG